MTPNELYALAPESVSTDLNLLSASRYNHIAEGNPNRIYVDEGVVVPGVEIRTYKEFYFDHRRFWALRSVWFNGAPVMFVQNAGREGDDHAERFITDKNLFADMCGAIAAVMVRLDPHEAQANIVDPGEELKYAKVDFFYGYALNSVFERNY